MAHSQRKVATLLRDHFLLGLLGAGTALK